MLLIIPALSHIYITHYRAGTTDWLECMYFGLTRFGHCVVAYLQLLCLGLSLQQLQSEWTGPAYFKVFTQIYLIWNVRMKSAQSSYPLRLSNLGLLQRCDSHSWRNFQFNSIQFILYSPLSKITNLPQRALQSVHIWQPCPRTSQRIRKISQEIEKNLSQEKKGRKLQESNRGESLSCMDRCNRYHVYRRNHYWVTTHSVSMTECMNSWL